MDKNQSQNNGRTIHFHGLELCLDPRGVIWFESEQTLLVADLHLEKGSSFARKGQLIPPYDTAQTLKQLENVINCYQPQKVITLGDNFHDSQGASRLMEQDEAQLNTLMEQSEFLWLEGNHDRPDFYKNNLNSNNANCSNAPIGSSPVTPHSFSPDNFTTLERGAEKWKPVFRNKPSVNKKLEHRNIAHLVHDALGTITLAHDAEIQHQRPIIAGHLHPIALLKRRGIFIRKPCFFVGEDVLILPSFGAYTGGLNIRHKAFDAFWSEESRIFMISGDTVFQVPPKSLVARRKA